MNDIHIVSFSGGKDSTALLLKMIELNYHIDEIIFCDTGFEFKEMYAHIDKVEKYINRKITRIQPEKDLHYWMWDHIKTKGKHKGECGYGWMTRRIRYCTRELKQRPYNNYIKKKYPKSEYNVIEYHGIALDEKHRAENTVSDKRNIMYPLIDWGMTEADCLEYCYDKDFTWDGLYTKFPRSGCWCCPLARINSLRILYHEYPYYWEQLKVWDAKNISLNGCKFRADYSIQELEDKFKKEDTK